MPIEEFLTETIAALEAGDAEACAVRAREGRDAQHTDDIGITERFNAALGWSSSLSAS